ncbi:MAG: arsenate reductase ArsC, partial [Nitrosarchaeum sp.]|nr:arsenate reductase ArsC [Nitrosarchaeum sp.]
IQKSLIVNMGCIDSKSCPALFVKDAVIWNIPDPKNLNLHEIRKIRDQIENEVLNLIKNLEA